MVKIYQVDSFTNKPFKGNPAAVCILERMPSEEWMLNLAGEMNLSETAYLVNGGGVYDLRWFTPKIEVDLCGHATLAAAHILWSEGYLAPECEALFRTRSGILRAELKGDWIKMDLPLHGYEAGELPAGVEDCLNLKATKVVVSKKRFLIEVESEEMVREMKPDLKGLYSFGAHGYIVTAQGDDKYDFVSRFFAPYAGIDEDPVTGSAHCCLANYWSERLNKSDFLAYQSSARGGELKLEVEEDRIFISGQAVTIFRGEIAFDG